MVTNSLVVFIVRDGNPKKIRGWNDLIRPGVQVVTPNPFTSGGARWNVMAAYGAQLKLGKTDKQAQDYLLKLFKNVVSQDKSARDSLQTFNAGRGDVLLGYENEALFARSRGQGSPFVIPRSTILIENPIAVVKDSDHKQEANAFLRFLRTPDAQKIFAEEGYRPVSKAVAKQFTSKFPPARVSSRSTSSGSAAGTRCRSGSSIRGTESWRGSKGRSEVSPARRADRTTRLRAS